MINARIKESFDKLNPSEETKEAMLRHILMQEQSAREKEESVKEINKRQRKNVFGMRKLMPVMAAVIVIGTLLCIPSVSEAVTSWVGRMFRIEQYMGTLPEEREHLPEVDAIMQNPEEEQRNAVYLLSETDELELFNETREEYGFEQYDSADWQWLKEIDPKVEDVLYENGIIYVTSSIKADASLFFFEGQDGIKLDWIGDTAIAKSGDTEIELYASSYGIQPQPGYYGMDGEINKEALKQHERVLLLTEYETLRKDNTLPEGRYTFTQTSRIIDMNVDFMSKFATVAVVEQTFPFDTARSGDIKAIVGPSVRFNGEYPLTRFDWDRECFYNENIDLSDVSVDVDCRLYTTGITVELNYSLPEGWDESKQRNFIFGAAHRDGMEYELFVDGVSLGIYTVSGGPNNEPQIEILLPESARKDASIALLRPVYGYATELLTHDGKLIGSLDEPQKAPVNTGGHGYDLTFEHVTMEGCDIFIPLN